MKYILSLIPVLYILSTTIANATDYYYCDCQAGASNQCVAGNNTNSGTSPTTPQQSFSNARSRFNSLNAGDSIRFCRGGSFISSSKNSLINNNSTSTLPVTITDYVPNGQSSLPRPIITQTVSQRLFALEDGGNADHEEGYNFSNLDLRCPNCSQDGTGDGFFLYNDIDYVNIDNISLDGFRVAINLSSSNATNPGSDGTQDYITIKNVNIINSKRQGLAGGANNLTVEDTYFENNGSGTIYDHNIYISRGSNIILRGNELFRSSVDGSNSCVGVPLVVHGLIDNMLIENNLVREDIGKATKSCWGITVDIGYPAGEAFTNITIRGNKVVNVAGLGIGVTACDTCLIENNVILQEQSGSFTAISAPNKTRDTNDISLNKVTIRNNSLYLSTTSGTGIRLGTEGTQHVVVSNAIHYSGTGDFNCLNLSLPASAYTAVNNNVCYFPNASNTSEWENGSGTSPNPLGAWQASGMGGNSIMVNPDYTSPTLPNIDFSLPSTSAAVSAGHNLSAPTDFRGKTRDGQPDVGAFEYGTFNPPAKTNLYLN